MLTNSDYFSEHFLEFLYRQVSGWKAMTVDQTWSTGCFYTVYMNIATSTHVLFLCGCSETTHYQKLKYLLLGLSQKVCLFLRAT